MYSIVWQSFVAVIEEASLTRAADVLCISQSAVSKRIQRLEEVLGAELLFDRNSKPPKPTSLANRIYEESLPLLKAFERLLDLPREDAAPTGTRSALDCLKSSQTSCFLML
jgi:DNA-binding transcriptional LysR family regulator